MESRFSKFDERERDLIRMALRRMYNDFILAVDKGLADQSFTEFEITALLYEVVKM